MSRLLRRLAAKASEYAAAARTGKPPAERTLFSFRDAGDVRSWRAFADSDFGGLSTATLVAEPSTGSVVLSGVVSTDLPDDVATGSRMLRRSGFCGMRTARLPGLSREIAPKRSRRVPGGYGHSGFGTV